MTGLKVAQQCLDKYSLTSTETTLSRQVLSKKGCVQIQKLKVFWNHKNLNFINLNLFL